MSINIKEKDGEFIFNERQKYSQEGILKKYRNDLMTKKLIKVQVDKIPNQIKEEKGNIEITKLQIEKIKDRTKQSEKIFKKRGINPSEELKKLREKYSDEELTKKSQTISEKQTFQIKDNGQNIERITKNTISPENEIILYASNQYYLLQAQENLARQNKNIEKAETRLEATREELEKVENSIHSIKQYFKKKRVDIDKLLDKQARVREKGKEKEANEIPYLN